MSSSGGRRLLAISWEMPPLSGPRAVQVSRTLAALARHGWQSTVIAVAPAPGGPLLRDTAGARPFSAEGVEVVRVPSSEERPIRRAAMRVLPALARRPDRHRSWVRPAAREAARRLETGQYERVVTFAQPWSDHLVGLELAKHHRLPWIAHFSDPWTANPYEQSDAGARALASRLEADVLQMADAIVFVTTQAADVTMRKYPPALAGKVHVIPHGYDPSLRKLADPQPRGKRMRIVYTGRFYDGLRTPDALFDGLRALSARRPIANELEVVLAGPRMAAHAAAVRSRGLDGLVELGSAMPYEDAMRLAAGADLLLVIDAAADGDSLFLPSKLVDYLVWRKPILGITPLAGASADLLRRLGSPVAPPDSPESIAAAVDRLLDDWQAGRLTVSPSFDRVAAEYDIERTAGRFATVLEGTRRERSR